MMTTSILTIADYHQRINNLLESQLPGLNSGHILHQAMRYSALNGGKRLRPLLVYAAGEVVNAPLEKLDNTAIAIECIHTYSLIHDDLPSMDDDDYRRGQMSCHKKFDEATAILAGDALQSFAFEILSKNNNIKQILILAKAIGEKGMVLGQSEDINFKNQKIDQKKLYEIHHLKTGKLITASVQLGLLCGEPTLSPRDLLAESRDSGEFKELTNFAENFGLAFQLLDDLSDQDSGTEDHHLKKQVNLHIHQAKESLEKLSTLNLKVNLFQEILEIYKN